MSASSSRSSTSNSETINYSDRRLAAADNATLINASEGSNLSIRSDTYNYDLSADVANQSIESMESVARTGINRSADLGERVFVSATDLARTAFLTAQSMGGDMADVVSRQSQLDAQTAAGNQHLVDASLASNQQLLGAITELGRTTATGGQRDMMRTLVWIVGLLGAAAAAIFIFRKG